MRFTFKIFVAILVIAFNFSSAQNVDFNMIDQHALNAGSSDERSVESLTKYLVKPAKSDLEKVRSFYVWITNNINYDTKAFFSGSLEQHSANEILKRKKAVCQGYSTLLKEMCNNENITCEIIPGYSKGYGYNSNKPLKNTDHAWNAVNIEDKWYLIDATWGSGYLNQKNKFERHFSNRFFFSDPEIFIYKHLPADPMWQLLESTVSINVFQSDTNQIKSYIATTPENYYFRDSLEIFYLLNEDEKLLKSAYNEYNFNTKLSAPVGYAYMKIAYKQFNDLMQNQNIDAKDAYYKQDKVLKIYEKALYYFELNNDQVSIQARRVCRDNIKSCKDNLKVYQQKIERGN